MAKKPRIGDVILIPTPEGVAYAHYTHQHPRYGALLRVFPEVHAAPLESMDALAGRAPSFSVFFPLGAAVNRGIVSVAGSLPVPPERARFPLFRAAMPNLATGGVAAWWLWDGENEWPAGALTPEQRSLPIRELVNDTLLVERIVSGWRPEDVT